MSNNISNFEDQNRISTFPTAVYLALFGSTNSLTASNETFIDRVIITSTGSLYTQTPSLTISQQTGSTQVSASFFLTVEGGKVMSLRITNNGVYSLDSKLVGTVVTNSAAGDTTGNGATVFISLTKNKRIESIYTKPAIYNAFLAAKEKLRLVLMTSKGEVPKNKELGTRIYESLLTFPPNEQYLTSEDLISDIKKKLIEDLSNQIPEINVESLSINAEETDIDKNKIGISLRVRHRLTNKSATIDLNTMNGILKEYYTNEELVPRPIRYLK